MASFPTTGALMSEALAAGDQRDAWARADDADAVERAKGYDHLRVELARLAGILHDLQTAGTYRFNDRRPDEAMDPGKLLLSMDLSNDAFAVDPGGEVAGILRSVADKIATTAGTGDEGFGLLDSNGNGVGTCFVRWPPRDD
jgi:hypothetical protein